MKIKLIKNKNQYSSSVKKLNLLSTFSNGEKVPKKVLNKIEMLKILIKDYEEKNNTLSEKVRQWIMYLI